MFAIFMLLTIFPNLCQQIMPYFVAQRSLYEVRERPSKTFSWKAFLLANAFVEIPWNTVMSLIVFFSWYYPIGLQDNAAASDSTAIRGFLMWLLIWVFLMLGSTFTYFIIAGIADSETGGNVAQLMFSLCLIFCGVLATPTQLPGFWIFMYRLSPFTYLVSAVLSTGLSGNKAVCSKAEYLNLAPAVAGQTCSDYLTPFANATGGYLLNPDATSDCQYCLISTTDQFLAEVDIHFADRWRNFGILFAYVVFNLAAAMAIYYWARVPKGASRKDKKDEKKEQKKGEKEVLSA